MSTADRRNRPRSPIFSCKFSVAVRQSDFESEPCSALQFMPGGNVFGEEVSSLNEPPPSGLPKGYENVSGLDGKGPENKWTPMNHKRASR